MAADADFMNEIIGQRKEDISNIANIMSDINAIAKDLAIETTVQGEKLVRLDQNMAEADNNAEAALGQLKQAKNHQKKAGKCLKCLVALIVLCLIIGGGLLWYFLTK